jgi:hypothetical protein
MAITDDERTTVDFEINVGGEPPASPRGQGRGKYEPLADAARENPGVWVSVKGVNKNVAAQIRKGQARGFKEGRWEATATGKADEATLWVKYLGDGEGEDA